MGIFHGLLFTHFLLLGTTVFFTATAVPQYTLPHSAPTPTLAPAPSPAHHGHHHHHHRIHHPQPPAKSPTYSSPPPSSKPPLTHPPVKPPSTQPPTTPHPAYPPAEPPTKPPVAPPTKAPAPYSPPPRKYVAVQGVVYCKSCNYTGINTLLGASPLSGAMVELRCRNTKYLIKQTATTDKNGYFFLRGPDHITTYGAHKCRVYLAQKPNTGPSSCSHATNLNAGVSGAYLFLDKSVPPKPTTLPFTLYTVGPFAYEPPMCHKP